MLETWVQIPTKCPKFMNAPSAVVFTIFSTGFKFIGDIGNNAKTGNNAKLLYVSFCFCLFSIPHDYAYNI